MCTNPFRVSGTSWAPDSVMRPARNLISLMLANDPGNAVKELASVTVVFDKCQLLSDTFNDDVIVWPLSKLPTIMNVMGRCHCARFIRLLHGPENRK